MRCEYCDISYSPKVMEIHKQNCPERNKKQIDEANNITLEKSSKTDLIVYIMSLTNNKEDDLKKKLKKELYDIAKEIEKYHEESSEE